MSGFAAGRVVLLWNALLIASLLAACGTAPKRGGYYEDDGPGTSPPANLDRMVDADPAIEPLNRAANNPYSVFGRQYVPFRSLQPYRERGIGSWYGRKFHGQRTSSGERYDMYAMTAAHPILPIPSYARVTNLRNGRSVVVRINDRGPFYSGRIIDLSYAAAYKLGYVGAGSAPVEVEAILPDEIRAMAARRQSRQLAPTIRPHRLHPRGRRLCRHLLQRRPPPRLRPRPPFRLLRSPRRIPRLRRRLQPSPRSRSRPSRAESIFSSERSRHARTPRACA